MYNPLPFHPCTISCPDRISNQTIEYVTIYAYDIAVCRGTCRYVVFYAKFVHFIIYPYVTESATNII